MATNKEKTHCPNGHLYTEENTRLQRKANGIVSRNCRLCGRLHQKAYYAKIEKKQLYSPNTISAFQSRIPKGGANECWLWTGLRAVRGYGRFNHSGHKILASRFALELAIGRRLDRFEYACHSCDNPPCCNPAHLFVGSPKQNMEDAKNKGRTARWIGKRRGSANPRALLTENQVIFIRSSERSNAEIARDFGVSMTAISNARTRATWRHLP